MARRSPKIYTENGQKWKALGGTSRNFENLSTGEIISRRQFDQRFNLPQQGFKNYLEKAKASPKEKRLAAPARGRSSTRKYPPKIPKDFSRVRKPRQGRSKRYVIPIEDVERFLQQIKKNKSVHSVAMLALVVDGIDDGKIEKQSLMRGAYIPNTLKSEIDIAEWLLAIYESSVAVIKEGFNYNGEHSKKLKSLKALEKGGSDHDLEVQDVTAVIFQVNFNTKKREDDDI